ncbi:MAG: hypothetical protein IKN27_04450 [Selenomonadaceae bacterium]|nr:hypothetical protein [Selenomonadaceae bacterium]
MVTRRRFKGAIGCEEIICYLALTIFGTFLLLYATIAYEPPAFFAYAFGVITELCWGGIVLPWWLRKAAEDEEKTSATSQR